MISLKRNKGFEWYYKDGISLKGYFYLKGIYQTLDDVVEYLKEVNSSDDLKAKLTDLDGGFAIVIDKGDVTYACVDRVRSIPIFYSAEFGQIITDDIEQLSTSNSFFLDNNSLKDFESIGCTVGSSTLVKNINQLQAGQLITFKQSEFSVEYYFEHYHNPSKFFDSKQISSEMKSLSYDIFARLIESCKGKRIVLPLSGGYDSRFIAAMLKEFQVENVICYTYGKKDSFEVSISKNVASQLGYEWFFVEYTDEKWDDFINDKEYHLYCSNFSSRPFCQEYIAIKELVDKKIINDNTVIIPGYCGDLLGGSFLPEDIPKGRFDKLLEKGLVNHIISTHFMLDTKNGNSNFLKKSIESSVGTADIKNAHEFYSCSDEFFIRHRASKLVVNAVRLFEYFGAQWRLPLWDHELIEFWNSVDWKQKENNKAYNYFLFSELFEPNAVGFKKSGPGQILKVIKSSKVLDFLYSEFRPFFKLIWHKFIVPRKYIDHNSVNILKNKIEDDWDNPSDFEGLENTNQVIQKWFSLIMIERFNTK